MMKSTQVSLTLSVYRMIEFKNTTIHKLFIHKITS